MTTNVYPKPTSVPRWADTSTNVIEPSEGKKDEGWLVAEVHPSSYENWKSKSLGEWIKWLDERWQDGASLDNIKLTAALEVDATGVAETNQEAIKGRGKGSGAGGYFYGGVSGHGLEGVGGSAVSDGDGKIGGAFAGGDGEGGGHVGGYGSYARGGDPDGIGVGGKGNGISPGVEGKGSGTVIAVSSHKAGVFGAGAEDNGCGVEGVGSGALGDGGNFTGASGEAVGGLGIYAEGGTPTVEGHGADGADIRGGAGSGTKKNGGNGVVGHGGLGTPGNGDKGFGGHGVMGKVRGPTGGGHSFGVVGLGNGITSDCDGIDTTSEKSGVVGIAGDNSDSGNAYGVFGWGGPQAGGALGGGVCGISTGEAAGVIGRAENGDGYYGVIARGKASAPKYAALGIAGQSADPTEGIAGAIFVTGASHPEDPGHLKKYHGAAFRHVGVQAWAKISTDGGGNVSIDKKIGVSQVSLQSSGYRVRVTWNAAFSDVNYVITLTGVGPITHPRIWFVISQTAQYTEVIAYDLDPGGTAHQVQFSTESVLFSLMACGD